MTEWRALSDDEIVDLACRLRSVNWPCPVDDIPELAATFGWEVKSTRSEWVRLDSGFGRASGMIEVEAGWHQPDEDPIATGGTIQPGPSTRRATADSHRWW